MKIDCRHQQLDDVFFLFLFFTFWQYNFHFLWNLICLNVIIAYNVNDTTFLAQCGHEIANLKLENVVSNKCYKNIIHGLWNTFMYGAFGLLKYFF